MTSRERELAVINKKSFDRISVDTLTIETQEEIGRTLEIPSADVYDALGIDGRVVYTTKYFGEMPCAAQNPSADEWGTTAFEDYNSSNQYPLAGIDNITAVEKYSWPDPTLYDFEDASIWATACATAGYAVRGPYWKPVFCRACSLMGMEDTLVQMMNEPVLFDSLIEKIFESTYAYCEKFVSICGNNLDILCLGDDFATQRGLLISPEHWRKHLKPRYAKLFEIAKKADKPVWFHSCGDITSVLPDLIDIGMDVWETVQLHTLPMTALDLKREYGKHITFFGGVNTQRLPFMTPDEVSDEVKRCIETLGSGGGYICGPDHHIKPDVPVKNTIALFRTATSWQV